MGSRMKSFETILYEAKDGVGTLTLNRPDRMNAMTNRMVRETTEALSAIALAVVLLVFSFVVLAAINLVEQWASRFER